MAGPATMSSTLTSCVRAVHPTGGNPMKNITRIGIAALFVSGVAGALAAQQTPDSNGKPAAASAPRPTAAPRRTARKRIPRA